MSRIKFVHAADLHLDSPFHGIASEMPEYVVNTLRQATFEAYGNIIELCLREQVDALLVAGDIYDGADRSLRAQLKFVEGLHRLDASGVRTFICHGNHDPLDGWEARISLPPGCVRFASEESGVPVFPDEPSGLLSTVLVIRDRLFKTTYRYVFKTVWLGIRVRRVSTLV